MKFLKNLLGKNEGPEAPFSALGLDIHSHLIPGIDDGATDLEDALALIRELHALGYRRLVTTPHIMSDAYRNTPEIIREGLLKVQKALASEGIEVQIEAAAEYYLDEVFLEKLEEEPLMTFGGEEKYLLFETSYVSKPMSLTDAIFRLKSKGYTPVLAHPERYQYFWELEDIGPIRQLRERGALMQLNITSFAGTRGRRAAFIAKEMARNGLVDLLGTDLHRMAQTEALRRAWKTSKELRELAESGQLLNHRL